MAQHYGITDVNDLWNMSWRRFVVLFIGIFSWEDQDHPVLPEIHTTKRRPDPPSSPMAEQAVVEAAGADGRIVRSLDWDTALGREPAERKELLTTAEFMRRMHGTR